MAITNRAEVRRLITQIERDVQAEAYLNTLLTTARMTVACHREELRMAESRIARSRRVNGIRGHFPDPPHNT